MKADTKTKEESIVRYNNGESVGNIARSIGFSKRSIHTWAREHDIPTHVRKVDGETKQKPFVDIRTESRQQKLLYRSVYRKAQFITGVRNVAYLLNTFLSSGR